MSSSRIEVKHVQTIMLVSRSSSSVSLGRSKSAQTPSAEIFLRFCEYGARSFIELDGKFFYETDQLSLIATLDELDGNGQGRAEKNGALQTEAWGGPVAAPTPA